MNIVALRNDLIANYKSLKDGKMGLSECKELSNTAGKILHTASTQMKYNQLTGNNGRQIKFLEDGE